MQVLLQGNDRQLSTDRLSSVSKPVPMTQEQGQSIAMLPVRNTNLFQFVILLTARMFNWLELPKLLFFKVNCGYPIGGTPDLSNRRRQDGLNTRSRVGNTRWATQFLNVKSRSTLYYRKMFLSNSGFIFCQGLCMKQQGFVSQLAEKQKPYTDKK